MRILGKSVYEKCPTQSRIRWTGTVEHPPRCRQITQINQRRRQARGFLLVFSASKGRRSAIERAHAPIASSTPAPPRKRRRPNQDLLERLARCEALLRHCTCIRLPTPESSPREQCEQSPVSSHDDEIKRGSSPEPYTTATK
ncbi:hypothetical protein B0J15DRAFT_273532 [Fusarium solani]|uniref:Uncharacterized protein n=1 Tax=Fusarium solani TaxID=169388 RepID=A0A9P9HNX9_FUSSL|nr:uncharacterized protein B0J15DRAFT_273532 [Fusarium solani]KAH7259899.1 hypothetical protein B0J15DRAFT_273532 [Fusarium solani]